MDRALIFDIGGVLSFDIWESTLLDPQQGLAHRYGLDPEKVRHIGVQLWHEVAYKSVTDDLTWQDMENDYWQQVNRTFGFGLDVPDFIQASLTFIKPLPGMVELLLELQSRNIPMAFCSNNSEFWYHRQLEQLELQQMIPASHHVLSSRIGQSKSDSEQLMFKKCVEILQLSPDQCIFIDDRKINIEAAIEFGFVTLFHPSHSLTGATFLRRIFTLMDLL